MPHGYWSVWEVFSLLTIGKRLGQLLTIVAAYSVAAGLIVQALEIQTFNWGSAATLTSTLVMSLLLSFRNRVAYDRWWEARGRWGQLTNDIRNLAGKMAAFVPAEALLSSRAGELLAGFAEALNRHLRGEGPRLCDLPGFEHELADPPHVPMELANRLYAALTEWKRSGLLDGAELRALDVHLRGLLDVCGACEKIRNTPVSPSYKTLLRTGLVLNILAQPWLTVPEIGFWGLPVFLIMCFFLLGIELIDSVVEEPFGRERDDLDLDRFCQTIREGVEASLPLRCSDPKKS